MPSQNDLSTTTVRSSNTTAKRKDAEDRFGHDRPVKRRAPRACTACRARKVRCDVTKNDDKCTNCKLDNAECIVVASRRGHARVPISSSPDAPEHPLASSPNVAVGATPLSIESILSPSVSGHIPVSVTFEVESDKVWKDKHAAGHVDDNDTRDSDVEQAADEVHVPDAELRTSQDASDSTQHLLPPFMKLPKRLGNEDLDYLKRKDALTIPSPLQRREIFEGYLYAVHPYMPMLDIATFSHALRDANNGRQISLLLFQAVMFAGIHALKPASVRQLGFSSVKDAREAFFNRVKLLYEFDVEQDNASIIQSLILMSNWYGKWDDRKHTWHWTGEAYDVARNMGLHREPTEKFPAKIRRFRRRLWWSLYTRDRLIALGTRRPMRIRDDEYDTSLLSLEDFDLEEYASIYSSHSIRQSTEEILALSRMCVQLVGLCVIVGHVVSSQYTVLSARGDLPSTMMVIPKSDPGNTVELKQYDEEISSWYQGLDRKIQGEGPALPFTDPSSCCTYHWAVIYLVYLTVVNVLHRAQALRPPSQSPDVQKTQSASQNKVRDTARSLTKSLRTMLHHDQVRFLGPFAVTALVAASLSHMLDVSADDEDMRDASAFRLSQTLQVLQALREGWASADAAVSFIATVTRRAGLLGPMQGVSASSAESSAADGIVSKPHKGSKRGKDLTLLRGSSSSSQHTKRNVTSNYRQGQDQDPTQPDMNLDNHVQGYLQNRGLSSTLLTNAAPSPMPSGALDGQPQNSTFGESTTYTDSNPTLLSDQYGTQNAEVYGGTHSNATLPGPFWDWNIEGDAGMDLDSMAFNYDFYSNTFQMI